MERHQWTLALALLTTLVAAANATTCRFSSPYHENCTKWFTQFGLNDAEYRELRHLVITCKRLIAARFGVKFDAKKVNMLLYGSVPTAGQARTCIHVHQTRHARKAMDFNKYPVSKWTPPIHYLYDGTHGLAIVNVIESAIQHWEDATCIRFKRVIRSDNISAAHLVFGQNSDGCWSYVGRLASSDNSSEHRYQPLNLKVPTCTDWMGLVVHEVGHALGLWHEQSRPDRDDYIAIDLSVVEAVEWQNFEEINSTLYHGTEYDMASVMQYSPWEFVRGDRPAIKALDVAYQRTLGQRASLSFLDKKIINEMYCQVDGRCAKSVVCKNGGYQHSTICGRCHCVEGFGGRKCNTVAKVKGGCWPNSSARVKLTNAHEYCVESRDYANGGPIKRGDQCNWLIEAPKGCKIAGRITGDFGLFCAIRTTCFQWLEVRYQSMSLLGPRFCCKDAHQRSFVSEQNKMMIILNARYPLNDFTTAIGVPLSFKRGFRFCYKIKNPECLSNPDAPVHGPQLRKADKKVIISTEAITVRLCSLWGDWSSWSDCTIACGGCGIMFRYRKCQSPLKFIDFDKKDCGIVKCIGRTYEKYRYAMTRLAPRSTGCCYKVKNGVMFKMNTRLSCRLVSGMRPV